MDQLKIWSNATAMMDLYAFVNNMPAIKKSLETLKTDTNTLRASASQLNDGECYEFTFISRLTPFFVIYKSLIAVLSLRVFFFFSNEESQEGPSEHLAEVRHHRLREHQEQHQPVTDQYRLQQGKDALHGFLS